MNIHPGTKRATWCLVLAGAGLLLLTACADGYPSDDEGLFLHFGMSREETVRAMNNIGAHRYLNYRWRYTVTPRCEIIAESGKLFDKRPPVVVPMLRAKASMVAETSTRYTVAVRPLDGPADQAWTLIEGATRIDATRIRWLAEYVPTLCTNPRPVPA